LCFPESITLENRREKSLSLTDLKTVDGEIPFVAQSCHPTTKMSLWQALLLKKVKEFLSAFVRGWKSGAKNAKNP
jgi:hypothetical protein